MTIKWSVTLQVNELFGMTDVKGGELPGPTSCMLWPRARLDTSNPACGNCGNLDCYYLGCLLKLLHEGPNCLNKKTLNYPL